MEFQRDPKCGVTEDGHPEHGAPENYDGEAIVAFIDLLGFSQHLLDNWTAKVHPVERLKRVRASTEGKWVRMQGYVRGRDGKPVPTTVSYVTRVHTVADSLVVSTALGSRVDPFSAQMAFFCVVSRVHTIVVAAVAEGFVVRGGIEVGDVHWSSSEAMGPAYVAAHAIESRIASSARVLLGPRMLRWLQSCEGAATVYFDEALIAYDDGLVGLGPHYTYKDRDKFLTSELQTIRDAAPAALRPKYKDQLDAIERYVYLRRLTKDQLRVGIDLVQQACDLCGV
jgi:hypothetical protein